MSMFSSRIKELRKRNKLKQNDLANLLGTTPQNYAAYEKGREPSYDNLILLCEYFKVSSDYILGLSDFPTPQTEDINELIRKTFHHYSNDFEELIKLNDFYQLLHFCFSYIDDKGKKLYLYDSKDTEFKNIIGVITSEQRYMTIIRRVLEQMSQEYYRANGIPVNRDISFDIDKLDDWEIELSENTKGGEDNAGA